MRMKKTFLIYKYFPIISPFRIFVRYLVGLLYSLVLSGDVFVHFMDMAEHELRKKHDDIVASRIESLLDLAVRTSVAANDPFKEDLKVDIVPYDLITQLFRIINVRGHTLGPTEQVYPAFEPHASGLTGVEAFTLDYRVSG